MNTIIRLMLFIILFLTSQSGIATTTQLTEYQYDVNHIALGEEIYGYDTTPNPRHTHLTPSDEKITAGSFIAFVGNFVVTKSVTVSKGRFPQSAKHIEDAVASGKPNTLTINRAGATANRRDSLRGVKTKPGLDRDEFPPAMFQEGGRKKRCRRE